MDNNDCDEMLYPNGFVALCTPKGPKYTEQELEALLPGFAMVPVRPVAGRGAHRVLLYAHSNADPRGYKFNPGASGAVGFPVHGLALVVSKTRMPY